MHGYRKIRQTREGEAWVIMSLKLSIPGMLPWMKAGLMMGLMRALSSLPWWRHSRQGMRAAWRITREQGIQGVQRLREDEEHHVFRGGENP